MILHYNARYVVLIRMIRAATLTLCLSCLANFAQAACFADYKAKQDDPLRLHYGVAEISGSCDLDNARKELEDRLASQGWEMLTILSVFSENGLDERKDSAGDYFLRF
jgi:hypothetical protein